MQPRGSIVVFESADDALPVYRWSLTFHIESVRNVVNPYFSRKGNRSARKGDRNAGKDDGKSKGSPVMGEIGVIHTKVSPLPSGA